jgi:cytochrome c
MSEDAVRGEQLYSARCGACHSLTDNAAGPRHAGLIGRQAGTQPGFAYSDALARSGIRWSPQLLDRWLENPNTLVPGNKMVVQLASEPHDRADIIAFLRQATRHSPKVAVQRSAASRGGSDRATVQAARPR